ncbi:MAG: hypothetical protein NTV94_20015 [Planctomycetota bacterium]|nr:hypothetical protein [Planctomycetota bacterium]
MLTARRDELRSHSALDASEQLELSAINEKLLVPVFEPGGSGSVEVHVTRVEGPESIWNDTVDIAFDRVGVLPEAFAYPMIGTNVKIRKVDYDATVEGGSYVGLSGATARIAAKVDLQKLDDPEAPFVPMVEVDASAVPVDAFMLFALPDARALSPDGRPLRELIRDMHLKGAADVRARIWQLEGQDASRYGNTAYDIQVDAADFEAMPSKAGQQPRLAMGGLNGTVDIRHDALEIDLKGIAGAADQQPPAGAPMHVRAQMEYAPPQPDGSRTSSKLTLDATSQQFNAATPVEDLVWLFAPEAAIAMADARKDFDPAGQADLLTTLRRTPGGNLDIDVRAWKPASAQFSLFGARLGVESPESSEQSPLIRFIPGASGSPGTIAFSGVPIHVTGQTGPAATVVLAGKARTDRTPVPGDAQGLSINVQRGVLGTPPVMGFLKQTAPRGIVDFLVNNQASGLFDAQITATPDAAGSWTTKGQVQPHSLQLMLARVPVSFETVQGDIEFSDRNGALRGIVLTTPTWSAGASGSWQRSQEGTTELQTKIQVDASSLSNDLVACLPEELRTLISDLAVRIDGPVRTSNLDLSVAFLESGGIGGFASAGQIGASGMTMDAGLKISHANVTLDYSASRAAADELVKFDAWALSDTLKAADVAVTNAKFRASSGTGATLGSVLIPHFSGDCHGGRISGDAVLSPPNVPEGRRPFTARAQGSNIRFASVIADFQAARRSAGGDVPAFEADATPDGSRGMVDFGVTLTGITSMPESRRGRGTASVGGGRVASMPLVVPLIRISNLQLPVNERLDYAQADFFVQGNNIEFEQAWISSPGVELVGYGSMQWPEASVDVRVRGSSRTRIPIVSKVMDSIRNELFTARVTGPLWEPKIGLESFNDTGRMIGKIIGATPSEATERLRRIEQNAGSSPHRPREGQPDKVDPASPNK